VADALTVDAGDCQSRFLNDGDDVDDLNFIVPTIDGGVAPRTCTWGVDIDGDGDSIQLQSGCSLAVQPDTSTTYCVDLTDATGCTVSDCVTVQAIDLLCHQSGKLKLCHVPPGNPDNPQELCLSQSAVTSHLAEHEGDATGPCELECTATNPAFECVDLTVDLLTDKFGGETSWELIDLDAGVTIGSRAPNSLENETAYTDTFCGDPARCYESRFHDSVGDGICCLFGQGKYSITLDSTETPSPSGGAFGSIETVLVGNCPSSNSASEPPAETDSFVAAENVVAGGFVIREQLGTISAVAKDETETESLLQGASDSITVDVGATGGDYGKATATTSLEADVIFVTLDASVGDFYHEGAAKGRVVVQFSVDKEIRYTVQSATTEVTGEGSLEERASIVLSNDDGVIFRKDFGVQNVPCNPGENPLCETLTPGAYTLELQASAYAPEGCIDCAVTAKSEVKISTP